MEQFTRWTNHLRTVDRFHLNEDDEKFVDEMVGYCINNRKNTVASGDAFYRARIIPSNQPKKYEQNEMVAPPTGTARAGRLNPPGIFYLYLARELKTCLAEVRPWVGAHVTVAQLILKRPLQIVNLNSRDPKPEERRVQKGTAFDYLVFGIFVGTSLAIPQNPDDEISYVPTQYLAEKFKRRGVDGIEYFSVLNKPGSNLALFDPSAAECKETSLYRIQSVAYTEEQVQDPFT
jgi:hypothetical protein